MCWHVNHILARYVYKKMLMSTYETAVCAPQSSNTFSFMGFFSLSLIISINIFGTYSFTIDNWFELLRMSTFLSKRTAEKYSIVHHSIEYVHIFYSDSDNKKSIKKLSLHRFLSHHHTTNVYTCASSFALSISFHKNRRSSETVSL